MRTDNGKVRNTVISIYFVFIVLAIMMATVFKSLDVFLDSIYYIFLGLFVILVLFQSVIGYFEYDSDGEKVTLTNRGLILAEFINYRQKKIKFSRNQLVSYKVKNFIVYKSLILTLKYNDSKVIKERFNITLLKPQKIRYVKQSLRKILKENRLEKTKIEDVRRT